MIDYIMTEIMNVNFPPDNHALLAILMNTIQILTSAGSLLKLRALALGYCTWFLLRGTV